MNSNQVLTCMFDPRIRNRFEEQVGKLFKLRLDGNQISQV